MAFTVARDTRLISGVSLFLTVRKDQLRLLSHSLLVIYQFIFTATYIHISMLVAWWELSLLPSKLVKKVT